MAVIVTVPAVETWRALLAPKRALPMLGLVVPLLLAQWHLSVDHRSTLGDVALSVLFAITGPLAWRTLFRRSHGLVGDGIRLAMFIGYAAFAVLGCAYVIPGLVGEGRAPGTSPYLLGVSLALFVFGSWGLARDIGAEQRLLAADERAAHLARETEHAQLMALRAHLDPHFLFNTLNAIAEWCREDGKVAEQAILQLSELLRDLLVAVKVPSWPLSRELALVQRLFAMHALRDASAVQLILHTTRASSTHQVPPMVVLLLAENALKHGAGKGHRGTVDLHAATIAGALHLSLENPGLYAGPRAGSEGLPFLQRRLEAVYGGHAHFEIRGVGDRTRAALVLPEFPGLRSEVQA